MQRAARYIVSVTALGILRTPLPGHSDTVLVDLEGWLVLTVLQYSASALDED